MSTASDVDMMGDVSRTPRPADVPPAARSATRGWRDPRLWVGVALVAGSVVAGARLLATADDTTAVWAAADDLSAGQVLTADDLTATRVRFADLADEGRYLAVAEQLPDELTLTRALGAGELVPEGALGAPTDGEQVSVSISLPADQVPTDVTGGSRVDVWVVGERGGRPVPAEVVLEDVPVLEVPLAAESFAATTGRQVVLAVPEDERDALAVILAGSGESLRIVGRSGS